jgi:hypothetical protein
MKIISYDVGIKNLAYCICDENMKIIKWDIIDLLNVDNKCSFCDNNADLLFYKYKLCKDHKKKVEELKELSTDKVDKDDKCAVCQKNAKCKLGNAFFCNLHRKSFETKNYKIKETNVSCDKISTAQFKYNLVTALDQLPELSKIDTVLIENQPSFKNPKMKAIADTLYAYYLIRCSVDKKLFGFEDIHLIAPNQKLKLSPIPEMEGKDEPKEEVKKVRKSKKILENIKPVDGVDSKPVDGVNSKSVDGVDSKVEPKKMSYKQGKEFAVKKCLSLIDAQHKTFLSTHKKKDDLCDCYLQAYHYLTKVKKIVIV